MPSAARLSAGLRVLPGVIVGTLVAAVGSFQGGYGPVAWGCAALVGLWVTALAFAFDARLRVNRAGLAFAAVVTAFAGWTAASAAWSLSTPRTMLEVERDLVYVAIVAALAVTAHRTNVRVIVGGLLAGLVALVAYALLAYFVAPPHFDLTQGYLLFRPIGYANALGGLAAVALTPILALAVHERRASVRGAAGAATVVLCVALLLTQNRSAWLACGCAIVVWFARTQAREELLSGLLVVLAPTAIALLLVSWLDLLDARAQPTEIRLHRLVAGACVVGSAGAASALAALARRPHVGRRAAAVSVPIGFGVVIALWAYALSNLGDRGQYWRVAWHAFTRSPLHGSGGGTFDVEWFRHRAVDLTVHDPHNLYLATLSELGIVGFVLLVGVLVLPLVAARRTRDPLLIAVLASYCGFLVHAAFEWDWKFPVVGGTALTLGFVLVVANPPRPPIRMNGAARLAGGAAAVLAAAFAMATLAGNRLVLAAETSVVAGDARAAGSQADRARHLLPWASEPWLVLADSRMQQGHAAAARAAFREALTRDRNDWTLWLRLAAASHGSERGRAVGRALALDPLLARR